MIELIKPEDTLALRSQVLRNGLAPDACLFETDNLPTTFHMGYFLTNGVIAAVLSCQLESLEDYAGIGYRLRGMATDPAWQGKGFGRELLQQTITYLTNDLTVDYLWCNARKIAYGFYQHAGFQFLSAEFEIHGIGPHSVMYFQLS
ncbi:GNAT family N-acetyltransferase [Parapedobacter lycopersici]|uniref:GNAT family N-acetyltransferase n=1 Tax=Parapedobacter lycopersici TaxID=1864939 RepID=UPI00333F5F1E